MNNDTLLITLKLRFSKYFDVRSLINPDKGHLEEQINFVNIWDEIWESAIQIMDKNHPIFSSENKKTEKDQLIEHQSDNEYENIITQIQTRTQNLIDEDMENFWQTEYPPVRGEFEHFFEDISVLSYLYKKGYMIQFSNQDGYFVLNISDSILFEIYKRIRQKFSRERLSRRKEISKDHQSLTSQDFWNLYSLNHLYYTIKSCSQLMEDIFPINIKKCNHISIKNHNLYNCYWRYNFFKKYAKRFFIEVTRIDLGATCLAMKELGHNEVFIKHTRQKYGVWKISLNDCNTIMEMNQKLLATLKQAIEIPGLNASPFIIQPIINFRNEYRFFITNGKIIKGTPVRRMDNIFDGSDDYRIEPFICLHHDGHDRIPNREIPARYTRYVRRMLEDANKDAPTANLHMVIDMGMDEHGEIYPIEVNSLLNAGRYGYHGNGIFQSLIDGQVNLIEERQIQIKKRIKNIEMIDRVEGEDLLMILSDI